LTDFLVSMCEPRNHQLASLPPSRRGWSLIEAGPPLADYQPSTRLAIALAKRVPRSLGVGG